MDYQALADTLTERRADLGLTQSECANMGGISTGVWLKVENNQQSVYRPRTLSAIDRGAAWPRQTARGILDGSITPAEALAMPLDGSSSDAEAIDIRFAALAGKLTDEQRAKVEGYIEALLEDE
jgi:transcriptional regulator with XRE-family HTH domain